MKLLVIDGQGGGIGSRLIQELKPKLPANTKIICVGTNVLATNAMLKAGGDLGATGENAVVYNAAKCHVILGPIGVLLANAMLGEITPAMALAVSGSEAVKILIPSSKCSVCIAGTQPDSMDNYIRQAAALALEECRKQPKE